MATTWINGHYAFVNELHERCIRGWRGKFRTLGKIDDFVKHIFGDHNQEADHLLNLGAEAESFPCEKPNVDILLLGVLACHAVSPVPCCFGCSHCWQCGGGQSEQVAFKKQKGAWTNTMTATVWVSWDFFLFHLSCLQRTQKKKEACINFVNTRRPP